MFLPIWLPGMLIVFMLDVYALLATLSFINIYVAMTFCILSYVLLYPFISLLQLVIHYFKESL